jgi:hypothetical protein
MNAAFAADGSPDRPGMRSLAPEADPNRSPGGMSRV